MAETRLYTVSMKRPPDQLMSDRLVDATSAAQALRFVADTLIQAEIAKPKDIVRLMESGTKIEWAAGDQS